MRVFNYERRHRIKWEPEVFENIVFHAHACKIFGHVGFFSSGRCEEGILILNWGTPMSGIPNYTLKMLTETPQEILFSGQSLRHKNII
jgi:hypothetical protein